RLDAGDGATEGLAGIGVDAELDGRADGDPCRLVYAHPARELERARVDDGEERLAGVDGLAELDQLDADGPRDRGADDGARGLLTRAGRLRLRGFELGLRGFELRLAALELDLGHRPGLVERARRLVLPAREGDLRLGRGVARPGAGGLAAVALGRDRGELRHGSTVVAGLGSDGADSDTYSRTP